MRFKMKTASQIREEIFQLIKIGSGSVEPYDAKYIRKQIVFLKQVLIYLESKPREEFVHSELEKLRKRQESITTIVSGLNRTNRRELLQLHNFSKIEYQINTLNFLIS
jgi:hypothetical protein